MTLRGPGVDAYPTLFSPGQIGNVAGGKVPVANMEVGNVAVANRAFVSPIFTHRDGTPYTDIKRRGPLSVGGCLNWRD